MPKQPIRYEGDMPSLLANHIYLNINHLDDGSYVLKIVHKNKIVKEIRFKK